MIRILPQYIFIKDATIIPVGATDGSVGQPSPVSFKKGEIISGVEKGNPKIDAGYVESQTSRGLVHISTGRGTPISLYQGIAHQQGQASTTGKYQFIATHSIKVCAKYKERTPLPYGAESLISMPAPVCEIYKQITFQIGDVVEVIGTRIIQGQTGGDAAPPQILNALVSVNHMDQFVPMYKLQKVSEDTPVKYSSELTTLMGFKKYLTPQNIVIGVLALAATYGILKFTKLKLAKATA